jgi:NhaP-type Na+/H+ or K+/H+ antiporter
VQTITVALFLLLAVVISGAFARMSPLLLPLPLVQIALGAAIASVADLAVELEPDIFFLLFLPPLLGGVFRKRDCSVTRERSCN